MKIQDMVDDGLLNLDSVPAAVISPTHQWMNSVNAEGIKNLLENSNQGKQLTLTN